VATTELRAFPTFIVIDPINANGPMRPLTKEKDAALQLSHSRRSSMVQHYYRLDDGNADIATQILINRK